MAIDLLILDDEATYRRVLQRELRRNGATVRTAADPEEGLAACSAQMPDVILLDLQMAGIGGIGFLQQLRARGGDAEVIILTGYPNLESAVEALRQGAYDYLSKPADLETLERVIQRAAEYRVLARENRALRHALSPAQEPAAVVSASPAMQAFLDTLPRIAASSSTVLLHGETGTGKEVIAREIHRLSPRAAEPLVIIDCGALQGTVRSSELFGHEKGAFTGAAQSRPGLFEAADRGTVFLDEIAELDAESQASLLRVLENSEIRRVGATRTRKIDVRVLAATHRDLAQEVEAGRFRRDLLYRLQVVQLDLPPLRERREDIPGLFDRFLERLSLAGPAPGVDPAVLEVLGRYRWPGNIRELRNVAEMMAVTVAEGCIRVEDLPPRLSRSAAESPVAAPGTTATLAEVESHHILSVYEQAGHNKTRAAELLGISLRTLYNKLAAYQRATPAD